ncbi:CPBP family intramembrane glutamic endopeptidase [Sporosarcina sp. G11-34]|uniref:CPBP family intramembrane glutamic endopeptidase n=1 Tax=Sporosarcina sp. G11-34 TaxID=2849605 RepID=UPI0022A9A0CF|nr:CPBP family intramembrane glutamic endopeptidase [Sporosarcina sp. G11-34]MCZ2260163.1 CPBP family intramembrane metalloprotease [Sporosarcina sp. G11-34]
MRNVGKGLSPLIIFALLALLPLSGLVIIFSIAYLLYERKKVKNEVSVFTFRWDKTKADIRQYWWLILLPFVAVIGQIIFAHYAMPTFNEHVMGRVEPMLHMSSLLILIPQLLFLAFGEELAFRGFAQEKLSEITGSRIAIIAISFLFAIAHLSAGPIGVVMYDIGFIFIDSILYGILFLKTKNVYLTTIAHFLANVAGIYIFSFM